MGAGFVRRYTSFPSIEEIQKIEGSVIVDLPPPASITGVGTGVVNVVGEFQDMTFAVKFNVPGVVPTNIFSTLPQTVEIFSAADLTAKTGGFDETLGEFGKSFGNGFVMIRNKKFARLLCTPINLASPQGIRVWRHLPTNASITNPAPSVPMAPATLPAGYMLKSATGGRVKTAAPVVFQSTDALVTGVNGATGVEAAVLFFTFTSAGATFVTSGVQEGDAVALGVIGGTLENGSQAGTYRVRSVTSETVLVLETQDQISTFTSAGFAAFVFRVHPGNTADSGGAHQALEPEAYVVPARPILNTAGLAVDGSYAVNAPLPPLVAPPAATANTWDIFSGLSAAANPIAMVFTAAIQKANAANSTSMESLYQTALDATITEDLPAHDINLVLCSRLGSTYRTMLKQHEITASAEGFGRTTQTAPTLDTLSKSTVTGNTGEGVGFARHQRLDFSWPGVQTLIPEAIGFTIACADGSTTRDGLLDVPYSGWLTSLCSNLAPERNPGELSDITVAIHSTIRGFQRGAPSLRMSDYVTFKAKGIAAPRNDPDSGFVLQSGITSSITDGERNINRQRMSDFIGDTLGRRFNLYAKLPLTEDLKDTIESEATSFLDGLLSTNNPNAQRISAYQVDRKSGNIPALEARGIFVVIIRVRTLSTLDQIVLQNEIGEGVVIVTEL